MERSIELKRPETERAAKQIAAMIADMERVARALGDDVVEIETHAKIYDKNDITYPPLARSLWQRQNNLKRTIAELQRRFPEAQAAAMETAA
jgi:hypothetical protein